MEIFEFLSKYIDHIIIAILACMSFLVMWFSVERVLFYMSAKPKNYPSKNAYEEALSKNLTILYIIYSNAPYIGLLGTVAGIMITFHDMGLSMQANGGGIDTAAIMVGLSLALKATALGLLVAIPTLMIYNGFIRKVDVLCSRFEDEIKARA